jgi:hypothetical protein
MTHHDGAHGADHGGGGHEPITKQVKKAATGLDSGKLFTSLAPFFVGLILALIVGWAIWPAMFYAEEQQPVAFNHLMHVEDVGMMCDDCHYYDDQGRFSGIPDTVMCLDCHTWSAPQNEDNAKETAFIQEYVDEYDMPVKPVEWLVYSKQPDCVYFSHIAHTDRGGFECAECHGDMGTNADPPPLYRNRLTGYSRFVYENMKMNDCGDCHLKHDAPENNACFVCHK